MSGERQRVEAQSERVGSCLRWLSNERYVVAQILVDVKVVCSDSLIDLIRLFFVAVEPMLSPQLLGLEMVP